MRPRLRQRLLQTAALILVTAAGVWAYQRVVSPDRMLLVRLAEAKLHEIFGPGMEYDDVRIDLVEGVTIEGLRVRTPRTDRPTLEAREVVIQHDLLAFASGKYRPESIDISGARIVTRETEDGAALDFPFRLTSDETPGGLPRIRVRDSTLLYRADDDSKRLRASYVLVLPQLRLDVRPLPENRFYLEGAFRTLGLGQDDVDIRVGGSANAEADRLSLEAVWDPLRLTPELLAHLSEEAAGTLEGQAGSKGRLTVKVTRHPEEAEGELRVTGTWRGQVRVDLSSIPGAQAIEAEGLEQIQSLFKDPMLDVVVSREGANIRGLVTALAGGKARVTGTVRDGGESLRLDMRIENLRLEHPAVRETLDPESQRMFDAFDPSGVVDAFIQVTRSPARGLEWKVNAILEDATFAFLGPGFADGEREGFPYPVYHANGQFRIEQGVVLFDDVVGIGRTVPAPDVVLRGSDKQAWTGGPTGRIRPTDEGPDIRLTVEARDVPVDRVLNSSVANSEFSDIQDEFWFAGEVDVVEVDIISVPGRDDRAVASVRLTLDGEQFRYARFPILLDDVKGWFTLTRPFIGPKKRGQLFKFDAHGRTSGAPTHVWASYRGDIDKGRLNVEGQNVPLGGELTATVLEAETTREGLGPVWRWLDPRGNADVDVSLPLGEDEDPIRLEARLRGASIRLDAERAETPLEIADLVGTIVAVDDKVTLRDLRGKIRGAPVTVEGTIDGGPDGAWDIHVRTDVLRVDRGLLDGLRHLAGDECFMPGCADLEDGSRLALEFRLRRKPGPDSPLVADVSATDLDGIVRFPSGVSLTVRGQSIRVRGDDVALDRVEIEAPGMLVDVHHAQVVGGNTAGLLVFRFQDYVLDGDALDLVPESVRDFVHEWIGGRALSNEKLEVRLHPNGSVRFDGDLTLVADSAESTDNGGPLGTIEVHPLEVSSPDARDRRSLRGRVLFRGFSPSADFPATDIEGEARIEDLRFGEDARGRGVLHATSARVLDMRVRDVRVPVVWQRGILRAEPVTGQVADGRLQGRVLLHTGEPVAFEGEAQIRDLRLEMLVSDLAPTGPRVRGRGQARLSFQSRGGDLRDLTAKGEVSIREGDLGDLPIVATIFAFLAQALEVQEPPRFERLIADFTLRDEIVWLRRFDLAGPLFEMPGRGTVDLGGFVDLTFTPDIIKSFLLPGIMQFPVVGNVLDAVLREDLLYAIRLRGDVSSAEPEIVALPPLRLQDERPFEGTGAPELPTRRLPRWFR